MLVYQRATKLVYNSNFTRTYGRYIELVNGIINQQTSLGGHHPASPGAEKQKAFRTCACKSLQELNMVYDLNNSYSQWVNIVNGGYKPIYNVGGPTL